MSNDYHTRAAQQGLPPQRPVGVILLACAGLLLVIAAYVLDPVRASFDERHPASVHGQHLGVGADLPHCAGVHHRRGLERADAPGQRIPGRPHAVPDPPGRSPLFLHLHDLFHWTHAEAVAADRLLQGKAPYLNVPFFVVRYAAAFLALDPLLSALHAEFRRGRMSRATRASPPGTFALRRSSCRSSRSR